MIRLGSGVHKWCWRFSIYKQAGLFCFLFVAFPSKGCLKLKEVSRPEGTFTAMVGALGEAGKAELRRRAKTSK